MDLNQQVNAVAAATGLDRLDSLARVEALMVEGLYKLEDKDQARVMAVFQTIDEEARLRGFDGFVTDTKLAEAYEKIPGLKHATFFDKWLPRMVAHRTDIWRQAIEPAQAQSA